MVLAVNVWLNFVELIVIQTMIYYFLSCLPRNIHRPKWCYLVVFFLHSMTFCYVDLSVGKCRGGSTDNSGWMYTGLLFSIYHRPDTDVLQLRICDSVDPVSGDCYIWSGKHLCTPRSVYYLPGGKCDDPLKIVAEIFVTKCFVWISRKEERAV
mgnify:CR=1 FL=1